MNRDFIKGILFVVVLIVGSIALTGLAGIIQAILAMIQYR